MYSVKRHRAIRALNLFLFGGAPEIQQSVLKETNPTSRKVGYIEEDTRTGEVTFFENFDTLDNKEKAAH